MTDQLTVTYTELRALLVPVIPHAGTDDMLPVLTCIKVTTDHGWVVAQATDRFTVAFRRVQPATTPPDGFEMLLQAKDAQRLVRMLRPLRSESQTAESTEVSFALTGTGEVQVASRSGAFALGFAALSLELVLFDGNFPDLLGLLPSTDQLRETVPAAIFNPGLIARFAPALDVCDTDAPRRDRGLLLRLGHGPVRPAWVTVGSDPDFLGAVMPRKHLHRGGSDDGTVTPAVIESWRPAKPTAKPKAAKPAKAGASS